MIELSTVRLFQFEVNAIFAQNALSKQGIEVSIKEIVVSNMKRYAILVKSDMLNKAKNEIDKLDLDESAVQKDSEGSLEGTSEWLNHMYNPTYYLGGKTPRYYFDKSNWKFFGALYLAIGVFMLIVILSNGFHGVNAEIIFYTTLYIFVGVSLIWQITKKRK